MSAGLLIAAVGLGTIAVAVRSALSGSEETLEAMSGEGAIDTGDGRWSLTLAQFQACLPTLSFARAEQLYDSFLDACHEAGIETSAQLAAFIAQVGHESDGVRTFIEYASGAKYEGRTDLGNTEPGDGVRYKGRGAIMVTGRANYRAAGEALGVDLEGSPELAASDEYAFRLAAWFWRKKNLNYLADSRQFTAMTRVINGGTTGLADRQTRLALACRVMGIVTVWS